MNTFSTLKQRHRLERDKSPTSLALRTLRALSGLIQWLNKAEQCEDDDSKFTFLWIAFNSAYAQDFEQKVNYGERGLYQEFLNRLVDLDPDCVFPCVVSESTGNID